MGVVKTGGLCQAGAIYWTLSSMHFPLPVQFRPLSCQNHVIPTQTLCDKILETFLIYGWSEYYITDFHMQFPGTVINSESESELEFLYWSCRQGYLCDTAA